MPNVVIYTTPLCPYCKMAKEFFKKYNIEYVEKDVSTDEVAFNELIQKSGQLGVPVIDINGEIVIGFDKEKLSKILNIK